MVLFVLWNIMTFCLTISFYQEAELKQTSPYELLKSDSAWCGPRVLFFLARLYGREVSLGDVVQTCKTDKAGLTSLAHLLEASHQFHLDARAVEISYEELVSLNKPALLCVIRQQLATDKSNASVLANTIHYIAYIKSDDNAAWIFDPSTDTSANQISHDKLKTYFLNRAIIFDAGNVVDDLLMLKTLLNALILVLLAAVVWYVAFRWMRRGVARVS